ncbi:PaaI family thioesterase [Maricaulis sp. CAU 1757]
MTDDLQTRLETLAPLIVDGSPHAVSLGLTIDRLTAEETIMRAPYSSELIGDPETGTLHGGVVTALLDHACGIAAFAGFGATDTPATLDLRIDYMRPARPGKDVVAVASSLKSHGLVTFVRATAHDGDPDDPVALAQAAFMISKVSKAAQDRVAQEVRDGGGA